HRDLCVPTRSGRRRSYGVLSSDVYAADIFFAVGMAAAGGEGAAAERERAGRGCGAIPPVDAGAIVAADGAGGIAAVGLRSTRIRSEERRVGNGWRCWGS